MNLFFDTSSLFKLYHIEDGTKEIINFFGSNTIDSIFLSEITEIEFCSAIWKKCRKNELNPEDATLLIEKFGIDSVNYRFVRQNEKLRLLSKQLLAEYWQTGLRTLDSIQLASALVKKDQIDFFFTSDKLLSEVAISEGLNVKN